MILGFDTSTERISLAINKGERVLKEINLVSEESHMQKLVPLVAESIEQANLERGGINNVAVGLGPGSFTATRIGVATAKTIAQVLNIPISGCCSLDSIAFYFKARGEKICVINDARRGEVWPNLYSFKNGKLNLLKSYKLLTSHQLVEEIKKIRGKIIFSGNGLKNYSHLLMKEFASRIEIADDKFWYPSARNLNLLSLERIREKKFDRFYNINPIYARISDAELAFRRGK